MTQSSGFPGFSIPSTLLPSRRDLPGALNATEVSESLSLHMLTNRTWQIFQTCATNGDGQSEAMQWLADALGK